MSKDVAKALDSGVGHRHGEYKKEGRSKRERGRGDIQQGELDGVLTQ